MSKIGINNVVLGNDRFRMEYKTFKKNYKISCEPEDVYTAITNPFTIELWTGCHAEMSEEPGSEFSMWDGDISGRNISFETDKKIVQEWYFGDQEEKSIVTMTIHRDGGKTRVYVVHENIPADDYDDICTGWDDAYMGSIAEFFESE